MELSHRWWKIRQMVTKSFDISCVSMWCLIACQPKRKSANHMAAPHCMQTFSNRNGQETEDWVVSQPAADLLGFSPHHKHLQRPLRTDPESEHIIQRVEAMRRKTLRGHHGSEVRVGTLVGDRGKATGSEINTACKQALPSGASGSSLSPTSIQAVFNQE